ncbi:WecB/TagA/CpsF family glycosyltransferase [Colwellia sp. RE-S-Sl-9]
MHPLLAIVKKTPNIQRELLKSIHNKDYSCKAISFINPFSYQLLRNKKDSYKNIDHYHSDAIISSWVFKKLLNQDTPRVSFDYGSFAKYFFETAEENQLKIFILGSKESELKGAITQFKKYYPKLNICGYHNGYFDDDNKILEYIKLSKANYVICGLGTPKQDEFAQLIKQSLPLQIKQIYTCGGFLHQSKNKVNYYPRVINKYNLRWLYRMFKEPKVAKRLATQYPMFCFFVLFDHLKKQ